jgi:hypothetical protein
MVRKNLKTMMMALLMVSCAAYAQENAKDTSLFAFAKSVGAGSVAGVVEVLVNQPQVYVKNALQQEKKLAELYQEFKKSPRVLYKGLGVGMGCMVPTTAAQVGFDQALEQSMPGNDTATAVQRNALAGAASALLSNPAELVVVNQQNRHRQGLDARAWPTVKELYERNGAQVAMRGLTMKALRDSLFCAGFLTAYPKVKELYSERNPDAKPWESTVAATAAVGPLTAVVTHPFDTLSTKMQADPAKAKVRGLADAVRSVMPKTPEDPSFFRALFAGLVPRTARVMVAIPLMSGVKDAVKDALNNE